MKPFDSFYRFIENRVLSNADERLLNVYAAAKSGGKNYSGQLEREAQTLQAKKLKDWIDATALATDPESPDRSMLSQLYDNLLLDNHLSSVIDSRILYCQRSPFKLVTKTGEENEELAELFERTWFEEFIKLTLFSRFQGATLIELFDVAPETGELIEINEIPQAYFNPLKGIITKSIGDTSGWPYKEGAMSSYYLQVGKNKELGILQQMAPIVLAKKLGFGSWLDYIEKYGIPSLFITTDREDDARLKQLYEAAENFKSNNFLVGRGNEKFEFAKVSGGNAENFDKLIERSNDEISKRVLGGSGLTDEKAFVGSAEIQFKLARDRFESDKLLIKNVINQGLIPRLAKISPTYSPLMNHQFVWDDSEVFGSKELADLVDVLGRQFIMDPEYVEEKTGIPILGQKVSAASEVDPATVKKKKVERQLNASLSAFYGSTGESHFPEIAAIDLSGWENLMDDLSKKMHSGDLKPADISKDFILNTYKELYKGAKTGYGKNWKNFTPDGRTVNSLKKNLFLFSGAKTYTMQMEMNQLLEKDGKVRDFEDFKKEALELNSKYNKNYLQAEYQTARQTAHHVRNWQGYQKDKDLFPNLKYKTTGDDRVRDSHRALDNIVKPIDDPFWSSFYPPNGWRCRCYVTQTAEPVNKQEYPPEKALQLGVQKGFDFNAAKTGEVYNKDKHPYFAMAQVSGKALQRNMELMKLEAPLEVAFKASNGAVVRVSPFADKRPDELTGNYQMAVLLAKKAKVNVDLIAHLDGLIIAKRPNPEYLIKGKIADRKTPASSNYKNILRAANQQGCEIVVIDLSVNKDNVKNCFQKIDKLLSKDIHPNIKEVYITDGKTMEHYKRKKRS